MGRPIKEKYFGNTNTPYSNQAVGGTTGLGGEGLASISVATAGSFVVNNTYKNFPLLNIAAPQLPGGVQATVDTVFEIDTVAFSSGGQTDADYVAGLSTTITGLGGGAVVNIVEVGNKVTAVNLTGGNRGEYRRGDSFDGTGITTFQVLQAPNAGTDLQINITFRVKSITIVEPGTGYTSVPSLSWTGHTFTGQTTPSGQTPVLTTTQYNAIKGLAFVPGGSAKLFDIKKQEGSKRYLVNTADGRAICKLVATPTVASGEMNIIASDTNGSTYFVKKLTARRAVLVQSTASTAFLFLDGSAAGWTLGAAALGVVSVSNN